MPTPIEAYRQGYERGRSDSAGGRLAEVTMGMLRDDPGGHFQKGYSDGAAGKPFSPPSIPQRSLTKGLIPKFSENPFGWFFGVLIVIEFWVLWQLIKAPFQLVGSLMRSEKPSPWVIVRITILAGVAIALVWWAPHVNDTRGPVAYTQASQPRQTLTGVSLDGIKSSSWSCGGGAHDFFNLKFLDDGTYVLKHMEDPPEAGAYRAAGTILQMTANQPEQARYVHDVRGGFRARPNGLEPDLVLTDRIPKSGDTQPYEAEWACSKWRWPY